MCLTVATPTSLDNIMATAALLSLLVATAPTPGSTLRAPAGSPDAVQVVVPAAHVHGNGKGQMAMRTVADIGASVSEVSPRTLLRSLLFAHDARARARSLACDSAARCPLLLLAPSKVRPYSQVATAPTVACDDLGQHLCTRLAPQNGDGPRLRLRPRFARLAIELFLPPLRRPFRRIQE